VRSWITDEATKISRDPKTTDLTIRNDIEQRFAGQDLTDLSKEALEFLVLTETAKQMTRKDKDSTKETVKEKLDSLSEMGEMESLRLQMAMDRLSKLMSTLSNLLKKASETAAGITQNIK
jgi:hypothetical protein